MTLQRRQPVDGEGPALLENGPSSSTAVSSQFSGIRALGADQNACGRAGPDGLGASGQAQGRWRRRRPGPILGRAALFFGIWLILSAPDLGALHLDPLAATADLAMAVLAAAIATWVSLGVLPPGPRAWRLGGLLALMGRFLAQSVLGGIDVARRAFHPRLPLRPGYIVFPTRLRSRHQRAVFETLTSATPGAIAAGTDAEGRIVYHCLDTRLPIAEGLARDEQQLLRLYREDACR